MKVSIVTREDALRFHENPPEDLICVMVYATACRLRPNDVLSDTFIVTAVVEDDEVKDEDGEPLPGALTVYLLRIEDHHELVTELPAEIAHTHYIEITRHITHEELSELEAEQEPDDE